MVITPVILPQIPDPSLSDCDTLFSHVNSMISGLENVKSKVYEVSSGSDSDEAIRIIQNKVEVMLSEAKSMRESLNTIKAEATRKMYSYNQNQIS